MSPCLSLGFLGEVVIDGLDDAQVFGMYYGGFAICTYGHAEGTVSLRKPRQGGIPGKLDDSHMEASVEGSRFSIILFRKSEDLVGHTAKFRHIPPAGVSARQPCGQTFKDFPQLVCLANPAYVEFVHEYAEMVDGLDKTKPLQFQQRLSDGPLGYTQFAREALLAESLARLGLPGKNPALDLLPDLMSCHAPGCAAFRHRYLLVRVI